MMKTRLGFLLLILISCTINTFLPNTALLALIISLAGVVLVSLIVHIIVVKHAVVTVELKNLVTALGGNGAIICIEVDNRFLIGSPSVSLMITASSHLHKINSHECFTFPIAPRDVTRLTIPIHSLHCDKTVITLEKIKFCDMLGIFSYSKKFNQTATMLTLPQPSKLSASIELERGDDQSSNEFSDHISGDDRSMVFDYHEYRQGDNIKDINWKLSARLETIIVKEFSLPITSSVAVISELHNGEDHSLLDYDITILSALSEWLHDKSQTHDIYWFCSDRGLVKSGVDHTLIFEEEFFSTLDLLYETTLSEISALDAYTANVIDRNVNTIYITSGITSLQIDKLLAFSQSTKLTVFYTNQTEPIPPKFIERLTECDVTVI